MDPNRWSMCSLVGDWLNKRRYHCLLEERTVRNTRHPHTTLHHQEGPRDEMTGATHENIWDAQVPVYERWAEPCSVLFA